MSTNQERILIVEDDKSLREALAVVLEHSGYIVDRAVDAETALELLSTHSYQCILSDFRLPTKSGLELLVEVRSRHSSVPFIIMTAFGSIDIATAAMKQGATDFICKPFEPTRLSQMLSEVIQHRRILDRESGRTMRRERSIVSESSTIRSLLVDARKMARVDSSVLILGESGVGKELFARFLHDQSPRAKEPFVAVNCGAIPAELLESDLFGHEAGSFTGATQTRTGIFEVASSGTIFLDEVGELPPALQVKLLRALQEREIMRVGGTKVIRVNPRVIAATNRNLNDALKHGIMREDFYYRLAVLTLSIPPLRERPDDVRVLIRRSLEYFGARAGKPALTLDPAAEALLCAYPWPGNARELENVIERAVILAGDTIMPEHLGIDLDKGIAALGDAAVSLTQIAARAARGAEIDVITRALKQCDGNKTKAAQLLGVSYKTLLNKVKEYQLGLAESPSQS